MSFMKSFQNAFSPRSRCRPDSVVKEAKEKRLYNLPNIWLDKAPMRRIHVHWTAGSGVASAADREHYHFLVEQDLDVIRGKLPVSANIPPLYHGEYVAHTRKANSYAIGVSLCGMAKSSESPFDPGPYPITEDQFERAAEVVAHLCEHYGIKISRWTVLTHAEIQPNLGIRQNGKWDIAILPWKRTVNTPERVGMVFRDLVSKKLKERQNG